MDSAGPQPPNTKEGFNMTTEAMEGQLVDDNAPMALINRSEIEQQVSTAHKFPRSLKKFQDRALQMVTLTEDVAGDCIYSLPRGGKTIEGPSARFAEIIVSAYGNSRSGARTVAIDDKFVTAQGVCHDLENNVSITFEVSRRITDRNGNRFNDDMIQTTANAASSIALRNAILKVVPKAFWSPLYEAAKRTAIGDFQTLSSRRDKALATLQHYGIVPATIFAKLGVAGLEDISLQDLATLRGLVTAIKEGDVTPEQAFAISDEEGAAKREMPKAKKDAGKKAPDAEPAKPEKTADVKPEASAEKPVETEEKPVSDAAKGRITVDGNKLKLLRATAARANLLTDESILRHFAFGVHPENVNEILSKLNVMAKEIEGEE